MSSRAIVRIALLGTTLVFIASCSRHPAANTAPPAPATDYPPVFRHIELVTLKNGMQFVLLPRHEVPLISGRILVRVGNVDNPEGATGLAHMFEHMAFKGTDAIGVVDPALEAAVLDSVMLVGDDLTAAVRADSDSTRIAALRTRVSALEERADENVEPNAWARLYDQYTTNYNAYTNVDVTMYETDLPSNNLEVWMLMESERLQHPVFREFYSELDVVKEERRQRTEDDPDGAAWEMLMQTAFTQHPYGNPTIGTMRDLDALNPRMIHAFYERYYTPSNMVGALVGDFDPARAREMLERYFGDIPAGPAPTGPSTVEPEPTAQRRAVHHQGTEREVLIAFPSVAIDDPRMPAATLLSGVLARGNTSRLDHRLDLNEGVARTVHAWATGGFERYPGLFVIEATLMPDATNEAVEAMIWEELARLQKDPVTDARLDELRRVYRRDFAFGLQKNADLAELLAKWQGLYGSWQAAWAMRDRVNAVTAAEVTQLAREMLRPERATVVTLEPAADTGGGS